MNVAIVGGGNFGTAIANIIARNGHTTHLWMRDPEQVAQTLEAGENLRYLPVTRWNPLSCPLQILVSRLKDRV